MSVTSVPRGSHLARRLVQLYVGLALYGASSALLVRAGLGLEPWGVLHQGLSERSGLSIGVVSIVVGAVVLLLWIPIRQRPGLGTVSNVFVIGIAMDGTLALVPAVHGVAARIALMVAGVVLNGVATGLYIAARFGPGPRDGLMTGLHRRTGRSIRLVRTLIEVAVVVTGFALGGSLGVGTVVYALAIGPLAQFFLRLFAVGGEPTDEGTSGSGPAAGTDGAAREGRGTVGDGPRGGEASAPGEASVPARDRSVASGSPGRGTRVTGRTPGRAILPR
ncbi:YczE/YyaS/YitT family protein [Streptomyces sp. MMS24-I29]|uniref:membrane protein YczE n=1 Tax=Streptomyces sp. MMS24-I29 TaxID=3351480 RepID=UPI003C7EA513